MKSIGLQLLVILVAISGCCELGRVHSVGIVGWPMKGGNAGRTWQGSDLPLQSKPELVWHRDDLTCTDAVADETRLFVSGKGVSAYDLATGDKLWSSPETRARLTVVHGKQVICVSGTRIVSLHAVTGTIVWSRDAPWVKSPPYWNVQPDSLVLDSARIYVACRPSGEVLAFDLVDGHLLWSSVHFVGTFGCYAVERVIIALRGGILIVSNRRAEVVALRAEDGHTLWRKTPEKAGGTTAGLALTHDGRWLQASEGYWINRPYDTLHAYMLDGPRKCWRKELKRGVWYDLGRYAQEEIATDGARVFLRRPNSREVVCLDIGTGRQIWRITVGKSRLRKSHPIVSGKVLLLLGSEGVMYCIATEDGSVLWEYELRVHVGPQSCGLLVAGRYIVVGGIHGLSVFTPEEPRQ
jgi:outer membrane protein assembly factor BamB